MGFAIFFFKEPFSTRTPGNLSSFGVFFYRINGVGEYDLTTEYRGVHHFPKKPSGFFSHFAKWKITILVGKWYIYNPHIFGPFSIPEANNCPIFGCPGFFIGTPSCPWFLRAPSLSGLSQVPEVFREDLLAPRQPILGQHVASNEGRIGEKLGTTTIDVWNSSE